MSTLLSLEVSRLEFFSIHLEFSVKNTKTCFPKTNSLFLYPKNYFASYPLSLKYLTRPHIALYGHRVFLPPRVYSQYENDLSIQFTSGFILEKCFSRLHISAVMNSKCTIFRLYNFNELQLECRARVRISS